MFAAVRVLVAGPKGAGKSTFIKYLMNSVLAELRSENDLTKGTDKSRKEPTAPTDGQQRAAGRTSSTDKSRKEPTATHQMETGRTSSARKVPKSSVCLLDLDPGQPEQALPSVLSIGRVSKPMLGSSFMYSIANAKNDQELAAELKLKQKLVETAKLRRAKLKTKTKGERAEEEEEEAEEDSLLPEEVLEDMMEDEAALGSNETHYGQVTRQKLLGYLSPSGKEFEYMKIVCDLMATYHEQHEREPLFVNTMGWLEGQGLVLLTDVIKAVKPTHVFHIDDGDVGTSLHAQKLESVSWRNEQSCTGYAWYKPLGGCKRFRYRYYRVMSNVLLTPTFKAADLRDLMYISYFTALWPLETKSFGRDTLKPMLEVDCTHIRFFSMENAAFTECYGLASYTGCVVAFCSSSHKQDCKKSIQNKNVHPAAGDGAGVASIKEESKLYPILAVSKDRDFYMRKHRSITATSSGGQVQCIQPETFECHGWGIVYSLHPGKRRLRVMTPVTRDILAYEVNVIVLNTCVVKSLAQQMLHKMCQFDNESLPKVNPIPPYYAHRASSSGAYE